MIGYIIVCSAVQTVNFVVDFGFGCQENDRDGISLFTDFFQYGNAVQLGHHNIQNGQIIAAAFQVIQSLLTVINGIGAVMIPFQNSDNGFCQ